jgi:pimeloyl-ACP methyl ester carboxylesterase
MSYVRFASTAAKPGPPIVYLAGGPGGSATRAAAGPRFPIFMALREVADVIVLRPARHGPVQRHSGAARLDAPAAGVHASRADRLFPRGLPGAWADWTKAGVAMTGYNTEQNADDIDDLRRHLGAEKVDLWGISYGTHLALSALKRHGDRINRVALASLEGQDQTVKRPAAIDGLLRQVDALLAADPPPARRSRICRP